jgi:hypothetical protein
MRQPLRIRRSLPGPMTGRVVLGSASLCWLRRKRQRWKSRVSINSSGQRRLNRPLQIRRNLRRNSFFGRPHSMTSRHLAQGSRIHQSSGFRRVSISRTDPRFVAVRPRRAVHRSPLTIDELAALKSRCREASPMSVVNQNYLWESASQPVDRKGAAYFRDIPFGLACQLSAHPDRQHALPASNPASRLATGTWATRFDRLVLASLRLICAARCRVALSLVSGLN